MGHVIALLATKLARKVGMDFIELIEGNYLFVSMTQLLLIPYLRVVSYDATEDSESKWKFNELKLDSNGTAPLDRIIIKNQISAPDIANPI